MTKKMSITDIAKIAGVSVSTVSRSLQDSPLISDKTKGKIQSIALEHNFQINTRARNFRTQKSHVIGLLSSMDHAEKQETSDQFLFSLVNSISSQLVKYQYDLLLHTTPAITANLAASYVQNQKVDGLIIFGQGKLQHKEIAKLSKTKVPFVVWGGNVNDKYTTVGSDNLQGGYLATKHLIQDRKKSKLIFLGTTKHLEISHRYNGFMKALDESNLQIASEVTDRTAFCINSGYSAVKRLISENVDFDGLVCASDTIALGALNCLRDHNIQVPSQIAVVGYDDISIAKDWYPSLSTIHQDTQLGGELLVNKILAKIDGNEASSTQMPVHLVTRNSS